jgi:hypothetical protein
VEQFWKNWYVHDEVHVQTRHAVKRYIWDKNVVIHKYKAINNLSSECSSLALISSNFSSILPQQIMELLLQGKVTHMCRVTFILGPHVVILLYYLTCALSRHSYNISYSDVQGNSWPSQQVGSRSNKSYSNRTEKWKESHLSNIINKWNVRENALRLRPIRPSMNFLQVEQCFCIFSKRFLCHTKY